MLNKDLSSFTRNGDLCAIVFSLSSMKTKQRNESSKLRFFPKMRSSRTSVDTLIFCSVLTTKDVARAPGLTIYIECCPLTSAYPTCLLWYKSEIWPPLPVDWSMTRCIDCSTLLFVTGMKSSKESDLLSWCSWVIIVCSLLPLLSLLERVPAIYSS